MYFQYALIVSKGLCLHIILLPNRAKSPQPAATMDYTQAQDGDKVQLNPCKSLDAFPFVIFEIGLDKETALFSYKSWNKNHLLSFKPTSFLACTDDRHLHFEIAPDCSCGQPRFWNRFPSLWSGCRLNHGVLQGRVGFEVRVERTLLTTQQSDEDDKYPHGLRVGWSTPDTSLLLGKDIFPGTFLGKHFWTCILIILYSCFFTLDCHLSYPRCWWSFICIWRTWYKSLWWDGGEIWGTLRRRGHYWLLRCAWHTESFLLSQ